jgi:formylglycine-generating enzyme required for sulfatase activity
MARLNVSFLTGVLIISIPMPLLAQQGQRQELVSGGNCARCHVSSTLEWGLSKHSTLTRGRNNRLPNCIGCHGESRDHVIDEQNTAKPDRVAHGDAIAALCVECHRRGCPHSTDLKNCQTCHHIHALVNPTLDAATIEKRAKEQVALVESYRGHLAEGERLLQQAQWEPARAAFATALKEYPTSDRAKTALAVIARRLKPGFSGFKIVGDQFDASSGLPKEIVLEELGLSLVLVPAGSFDLGSDQHADAKPVHTVVVAPFYLAKFELTQAQWKALMGKNPSYYQGEKFPQADQLPVEQVSWNDSRDMLGVLNQRIPGGGFRLPTEAEWEYAARAGSADSTSTDAAKLLSVAWLRENSRVAGAAPDAVAVPPEPGAVPDPKAPRGPRAPRGEKGMRSEKGAPTEPGMAQLMRAMQGVEAAKLAAPDKYAPHPVGTTHPNRWGLYDMEGNVSEWCSSLDQPYPFNDSDGRELVDAQGLRVLRGDTFMDSAESADLTLRHADRPTRKLRWNGVRVAFSPPAVALPAVASDAKVATASP